MEALKIFRCVNHLFPVSLSKFNTCITSRSLGLRYRTNIFYSMNTVYFRSEKDNGLVDVKLIFHQTTFGIKKEFNFKRKLTETLDIFLGRVNDRIEKILAKKLSRKKKTSDVTISKPEINSSFTVNNEPLAQDTILEHLMKENITGELKLKVLDCDCDVLINFPIVTNIKLPEALRAGSVIFPEEFEVECTDIESCEFQWFKATNQKKWIQCGSEFCYNLAEEDLNHFVKLQCTPKKNAKIGPIYEVISETVVKSFPEADEIRKRHEFTKTPARYDEIRIVSYNILAELYLHTKEAKTTLFSYCDQDILDISYRKDLLIIELTGYNADLIFLQEADKRVFLKYILPVLARKGFHDCYHEKEGFREGCAVLYNKNKFKLYTIEQHVLTDAIMNYSFLKDFKDLIVKNEKLVKRLDQLPTQVQVGVLECLTQQDHFVVFGNAHMYFHPDADHIRLLQGLSVFRILLQTAEKTKSLFPNKNVSIILCGDFNSTPECGFHQFLKEGSVDSSHIDWKSKEDEAIKNLSCSHSVNMKCAYEHIPYTNYTALFKACLDYIYFQADYLEVKQVVPLPPEEVLSQYTGIPSKYFPSDHLALVTDLKYKCC